ncbi:MAG: hypothetical protein OXR62_06490 [Ahrensia sp.]|nr:hypothetical protein [Ahrensia sp.]
MQNTRSLEENVNPSRPIFAPSVSKDTDRDGTMLADYSEALSWRLDTFRPSDREAFKLALEDKDRSEAARFAVKLYLMNWADADWHDDSVRRLGKWIGKNADSETRKKLASLVRPEEHVVYQTFVEAMNKASGDV